jgi:prophage regulatory protein
MLRLLHRKEVERLTSLTRSTIYSRMEAGTFPKPVPIGPMRVGWVESEVLDWLKACVAERDTYRKLVVNSDIPIPAKPSNGGWS